MRSSEIYCSVTAELMHVVAERTRRIAVELAARFSRSSPPGASIAHRPPEREPGGGQGEDPAARGVAAPAALRAQQDGCAADAGERAVPPPCTLVGADFGAGP